MMFLKPYKLVDQNLFHLIQIEVFQFDFVPKRKMKLFS
jgi:hypothetical protein